MKITVQALQELYVKLGGELTDTYEGIADGAAVGDYVTIPDMIEACAQIAENGGGGGGSDLPTVTEDDNGDFLKVIEGEWAKGTLPENRLLPNVDLGDEGKSMVVNEEGEWSLGYPGGGGGESGTLYIDLDNSLANSEVTYGDILDAIDAGKAVVLKRALSAFDSAYEQCDFFALQSYMLYTSAAQKSLNKMIFAGVNNAETSIILLTAMNFEASDAVSFTMTYKDLSRGIQLTDTGTALTSSIGIMDVYTLDYFWLQTGSSPWAPITATYFEVVSIMDDLGSSQRNITIKNKATGTLYTTGDVSQSATLSFTEVQS